MPKITVTIPYYNDKENIRRAVDSILNQTFSDFKLVVINDCSTDKDIWEPLKNINDSRLIRFSSDYNGGWCFADQISLFSCESKYWTSHDSDDWADKDWLRLMYEKINGYNVSFCKVMEHKIGGKIKEKGYNKWNPESMKCQKKPLTYTRMSSLWDTNWLKKAGGLKPDIRICYDSFISSIVVKYGKVIQSKGIYNFCRRKNSLTFGAITGYGSKVRKERQKYIRWLWGAVNGMGSVEEVGEKIRGLINPGVQKAVDRNCENLRQVI